MPVHRKNTAKGAQRQLAHGSPMGEHENSINPMGPRTRMEADWFAKNRIRQRRRNQIAKASRRKNRGK